MRGLLVCALLAAVAAAQDAKGLLADDPAVRAAAAEQLAKQGPAAAPAVKQLIELLYDEVDAPTRAAIRALGSIGPAARDARVYLVDLALLRSDFEPLVAQALARIGTPPEPPLIDWLRGKGALPADARTLDDLTKHATPLRPRLLEALADERSLVVAQAARLLAPAARSNEEVLASIAVLLDDPSACVRLHAAIALCGNPQATTLLASMLLDPRVARRRLAARFLRGPPALPHLLRALADEDVQVRRNAAGGFELADLRDDPDLVIALAEVLDRDPALCPFFATVLGFLGPPAAPTVPAFVRCLASDDAGVRWAACDALGRIRAASATGALVSAACDENQGVASAALNALAALGPAAKDAAPFVAELAEADLQLGPQARAALAAIGEGAPLPPPTDPADLPALRAALADPEGTTAGRAAFAIGRLAPDDAETIEALGAALEHPSAYARKHAALALRRIGPKGLPEVARAANAGSPRTRRLAAMSLVPFAGVAPDDFLPFGLALLAAEDPLVKAEAIRALGVVGPRGRDGIPAMIAALSAEDRYLAQAAIFALGQMRSAAGGAVPNLVELMETTGDPTETWMAILALGQIGPAAEAAVPSVVAAGRRRKPGPELFSPAVEALANMGPAGQAALVQLIREEKGVNRQLPINALARLGLNPPGFKEALDEVVKDADVQTREIALMAIRGLGPESKPGVDTLIAVVKSGTLDTRSLQSVVGNLAEAASVSQLLELARDKDARVAAAAWLALAAKDPAVVTGAERDRAYPLLLTAIGDPRPEVALSAAAALRCVPLRAPEAQVLLLLGRHGDARTQISDAILALGPKAVPALVKALGAKNRDVRVGAALALARFGPDARVAVPALRDAALREKGNTTPFVRAILATKDLEVFAQMFREAAPFRRSFGDALVEAGADAIPHFDKLRKDDDALVRREALLLAPQLGEATIPWLLAGAEDKVASAADAAIQGLGADLVPPEKAIPALARACNRPEVRAAALRALARRGAAALPTIRAFATDPDPRVRAQALAVLSEIGKPAVPLLADALADEDASVRRTAAMALGRCKQEALPALPALRGLLADPQIEVRGAASSALAAIGPAAVQPLIDALKNADPRIRAGAAYALREMGADANGALPALLDARKDTDPQVRRATAMALGAFGPAALDPLVEMCKDVDPSVRAAAAGTLAILRQAAAPALPALCKLLKDPDEQVRVAAARTLGYIGKDAEPAIPDLLEMLRRGNEMRRAVAAEALRAIGPAAAPALARAAVDPDPATRGAAQDVIAKLGAAAVPAVVAVIDPKDEKALREAAATLARIGGPAVPALIGLLGSEAAAVRRNAAWALGTIGNDAKEAVPGLIAALDDKDRMVPPQAAWALGQIGPAAAEALPALEKMKAEGKSRAIVTDAIQRIRGE